MNELAEFPRPVDVDEIVLEDWAILAVVVVGDDPETDKSQFSAPSRRAN